MEDGSKINKKILFRLALITVAVFVALVGMQQKTLALGEKETTENAGATASIYTADEVKAMIDVLPSVSELESMDDDELNSVYEQAQEAYDAFEALTEEEQGELANELQKLTDILDFYTDLTEPFLPRYISDDSTSNVNLKLSSALADQVSENTWTAPRKSGASSCTTYTFKSITLVDNNAE